MTVTPVYDDSEAVELCATYRLYLKPRAKLIISVILPEEKDQCRPISNWDILEQMKNLVAPDQFSSLRILKSTKEFMRLEGETDTKQLLQVFLEKLNVQTLQVKNLTDPVRVDVAKEPLECLAIEEPKESVSEIEDNEDNNTSLAGIHLEGLPCKWFSEPNLNTDKPSEEVFRSTFEKYGKIVHMDIPILDPYREVHVGNPVNPCGLQAFEAFIQYENKSMTTNALCSLQGMKLMYAAEDGKSLACDFKVSLDITNHFSEEAISKRAKERLHLQELEQQRKQEKEEEERKRKIEERKVRARRRRAKLKRRLQRQKREQKTAEQHLQPACPEDAVEDTEEWEERKLVLAQRRLESIQLLTVLLDKVNDLVQVNRLEEEQANCEFEAIFSDFSVSSYSENSKVMSPHLTTEEHSQHEAEIDAQYEVQIKMCKEDAHSHINGQRNSISDSTDRNCNYNDACPLEYAESHNAPKHHDVRTFRLIHSRGVQSNRPAKKQKIYETDEFIHYLLNYYDYPEYARLFLETNDISSKQSNCQRLVLRKGDSFQIKLQNLNGHFAEMNFIPELEEETENISSVSEENDEEPHVNLQETVDSRKPTDEPLKIITEAEPEAPLESKLEKKSQKAHKKTWNVEEDSSESNTEMKKVLEEISSTSEYFSEELSGTSAKQANIKRASRKLRRAKQIKRMKQFSVSGHNQLFHHKDLLGHLLHSYCQRFKKHSKHKLPKACQRKPKFIIECNSETSASDSDTEVEVRKSFKRKRTKIKNHGYRPDIRKYNKVMCSSSDSENSLNIPHLHAKAVWRHKLNAKPKAKKLKITHSDEKPKGHWSYCFAEDVSDSLEPEESLPIEEETQSSLSSSLEHEESDICLKKPHRKYFEWDHHFYNREQIKS